MTHRMTNTEYNDHVRRSWAETTFQAHLVARARELGWLVQHSRKANTPQGHRTPITGHKGYPDLTLARAGRLIIAELKTETGTVTADQRRWLEALTGQAGIWPNYGAETVDRHTRGTGILWAEEGHPDATTRLVALWRPRHWDTITGILADSD